MRDKVTLLLVNYALAGPVVEAVLVLLLVALLVASSCQ